LSVKHLPVDEKFLIELADTYQTPFHLYDEKAIRENARAFKRAFSWVPNFKNYFAVKACPNPEILKILKEEGFGADCSSLAELILSEKVGITGEDIMFTSNDTPSQEFAEARRLGAIINLDDITHIETLKESGKLPSLISFRYNPGPDRTGNAIIGNPIETSRCL
jgi:diaminopimelate decarboxylase